MTVIQGALANAGWSISVCQSLSNRENVSEYVVKVEAKHNNIIHLISCFLFRTAGQDTKVVFCQRNNGVARVLRKSRHYTNATIIPFRRPATK